MAEQLDSKYDRFYSIVSDQYGVDPLKDKVMPSLLKISTFQPHIVTQDERGSPDLIALRQYGSEKLWWIVLAYNGIASYKDIVEGTQLKIPTISAVVEVITQNSVSSARTQRVITI